MSADGTVDGGACADLVLLGLHWLESRAWLKCVLEAMR